MGDPIFALDIGTRSVTGIILEKLDHTFTVIDYYMKEHTERSMRDGQIHNVVAVAQVIQEVKEKLEEKVGSTFTKTCVAAAGRSLKTVEASASISLHHHPITDTDVIKHLELTAVQHAQHFLAQQEKNNDYNNYYCVGYSVLNYKLDQEQIGSLIDQSGEEATVEIIATFLPKVVVESLLAALRRADLDMEALTLEPIAAIHVLIPESMRRLNVALVDIGAGTSDIAITDRGTVVAYGMVPIAGDEVTEAISDHYLLDFPKAEETKREIVNNGEYTVADILGFESIITYEKLAQDIAKSVERLAEAIAAEIIQLNAKAPRAIMLVGGGSLTPNLTTALADKLDLPHNRVAIRGIDAIQNLRHEGVPTGPDFVTPIGIAIAAKQNPVHYVSVTVNKQVIRLFEMKQLTIGDCLIQAGIKLNKLYGKPGLASIVTVNGKEITLPGSFGEAPQIYLNNNIAHVDDFIKDRDEIEFVAGADGKPIKPTLQELIGDAPMLTVFYNKKPYKLQTDLYVNGSVQNPDYVIKDGDKIMWKQTKTIRAFLQDQKLITSITTKPFTIRVNNRSITITTGTTKTFVNNEEAALDDILKSNDRIEVMIAKQPTVRDLLQQLDKNASNKVTVTFNGEKVTMTQPLVTIKREQDILHVEDHLQPHDILDLKEQKLESFIFQDVFRYVHIDLSQANGKFKLLKNNSPTSFDDVIISGDKLEIRWED
ncbi:cell division protein FtsA [Oceanobacillus polygoni]|uniref:Cell division protein FtsA n=1 Tax=Oceanobacillus polygoni TaxID=1235259 RepID=A0A9X1CB40_9BACI|nr:cell division protein FtsA [Oceanobacillus polygoni]MBP2077304.1 cell division protein FtsA [Oceanobacillus polygoni]